MSGLITIEIQPMIMLACNSSTIPLALWKLFPLLISLPRSIHFPAEHGMDGSLGDGGRRHPRSSSLCFPTWKILNQRKRYRKRPEKGKSILKSKNLLTENQVHWECKPVFQNAKQSQLSLQQRGEECFARICSKTSFPSR